jgi:hypothetical protein
VAGIQIGFQFGFSGNVDGSGATISHLKFEGPDMAFPVFNHGGADDVSVIHCTMISPVQGLTNWAGNRWKISQNAITDLRSTNGGAFGIVIADQFGKTASNNVVSHNKISGTLYVECLIADPYTGAGILLFADWRFNRLGAFNFEENRVVKNKISLVSDAPNLVDASGIKLDDCKPDPDPDVDCDPDATLVIKNNAIGFNDLRGTVFSQIILDPGELGNSNNIDMNLGNNRGHGLHPSVFGPGGN